MHSYLPIPDKNCFYLLGLLALLGLAVSVFPVYMSIWTFCVYVISSILLFDYLFSFVIQRRQNKIAITRKVPGSIPLGVSRIVDLKIANESDASMTLSIFDHFPNEINAEGLPIKLSLPSQQHAEVNYKIVAHERGKLHFAKTQIRVLSWLHCWRLNRDLNIQSDTNVYPNFAAISHYALMATDNNLSQLGIIKKQRRGEGQDFHQLREYREGDALRQIDWKATSRIQKLISREYQDERDQEIIFMLDCGHRMSAKDGELSHFDHTLNALLLLSYVALRQGDAVGLMTFSGESNNTSEKNKERWLSPRKGHHTVQNILNTVYDLQPSSFSPDYSKAATDLLIRHKKRALVIILTNTRDEDSDDLLPTIRLLKKRHLVLLASLKEGSIEAALENTIHTHQDALDIAATQHYLQQRKQAFEQFSNNGITSMDVDPEKLTVELINAYLNIKSSGAL